MKKLSVLVVHLLLIIFITNIPCYAEPLVPREWINANIHDDIRSMIENLYSNDEIVRGRAAIALGKKGKQAVPAMPFLISMLADNVPLRIEVTGFGSPSSLALDALKRIDQKWQHSTIFTETIAYLVESFKNSGTVRRRFITHTFYAMKSSKVIEPCILALNDEDGIVRQNASICLADIKDLRIVEPLISALNDTDESVRLMATNGLANTKDPRAVEPLIAALKDGDRKTNHARVAYALGEIKDRRAVEPLIFALTDRSADVRMEAAHALGKIKDPRAIEPLKACINDYDTRVSEAAGVALKMIRKRLKPRSTPASRESHRCSVQATV